MSGDLATSGGERDPSRRLLRTIVCTYTRSELPASWIQVFRRFERSIARARLHVRVRLEPIEDLPDAFEVLVVAPDLAGRAAAAARGARVVVTTREQALEAVNALLREVADGGTLYAELADPDQPVVVTRRGGEVV